ncbi:MAG: glutamyl-tRNA reductase [Myxococcota bacterium]
MAMSPDPLIYALGLNHHTAPVEVRERLALDEAGVVRQLSLLREQGVAREAFIVSTCNRVELYAVPGEQGPSGLRGWFRAFRGPDGGDMERYLFQHHGMDAVTHLFRVASSLDSLVVGEPQILGQVKEAVRVAEEQQSLGRVLSALTRRTLKVAKRVRTETDIGRYRVGVGNAGVDLATQIFGDLSGHRAMLLGTGEMGQQVSHALQTAGIEELVVANRTFESAVQTAQRFGATPIAWDRFEEYLPRVDVVVAATGAQSAILTASMVKKALRKRRYRSLLLVDLAVPRNIDPAIDGLDGAYLFNVDDLKQVLEQGLAARESARQQAEQVVDDEAGRFLTSLARVEIGPRIGAVTRQVEQVRVRELARSQKFLDTLEPGQLEQLDTLTRALAKKILHEPLRKIHEAAQAGNTELLEHLLSAWKDDE